MDLSILRKPHTSVYGSHARQPANFLSAASISPEIARSGCVPTSSPRKEKIGTGNSVQVERKEGGKQKGQQDAGRRGCNILLHMMHHVHLHSKQWPDSVLLGASSTEFLSCPASFRMPPAVRGIAGRLAGCHNRRQLDARPFTPVYTLTRIQVYERTCVPIPVFPFFVDSVRETGILRL